MGLAQISTIPADMGATRCLQMADPAHRLRTAAESDVPNAKLIDG
jgi:hypothetical protein